jgi:glyoxylase-like metal-dependent hydrolase (beta-lactamase superfamily II)
MTMRMTILLAAGVALAACQPASPKDEAEGNAATPVAAPATPAPATAAPLSLTRLDCGTITIKNFDKFFSDKPGLYAAGARDVADSCYLIRHGDQLMLWDTGLPAELRGKNVDMGEMVPHVTKTLVEQLAALDIKPEEIDVVGISHSHSDHTGQAAAFPNAKLVIGTADFDLAQKPGQPGGPNPIAPWVKAGATVQKVSGDTDLFGDGSVTALHLPGHTPDHMALLVNLKSGPVLLSGDLYHSTEARQKRGVPPFNTSRPQTLASMDAFEAKAKALGAKVIIQHEPADIAKLPAFPAAAK